MKVIEGDEITSPLYDEERSGAPAAQLEMRSKQQPRPSYRWLNSNDNVRMLLAHSPQLNGYWDMRDFKRRLLLMEFKQRGLTKHSRKHLAFRFRILPGP
ncbi:unnamed protein product [Pieris brassicae]|uniref:Uncharacterized protein n=1 Tax=Pieris brassicae TaxID=7116 RepID=A0A9P0XJ95_PIEBR|nr:unnamed protein product [Pieris brassicae]